MRCGNSVSQNFVVISGAPRWSRISARVRGGRCRRHVDRGNAGVRRAVQSQRRLYRLHRRLQEGSRRAGHLQRGLAALDGVTLDDGVIAADRRQKVFDQTFEQFSGRMISKSRLSIGEKMMLTHASMLQRIEKQYRRSRRGSGCDLGSGNRLRHRARQAGSVVRSVATLAYDCRRSEKFHAELTSAPRIVDRGDMASDQMVGEWAGEIGQTQFLPSSYDKYAIDFDGNGPRSRRQRAGCSGVDRELSQRPWLAARLGLESRPAELRSDQGMEQGRGLRQDHRAVRREA